MNRFLAAIAVVLTIGSSPVLAQSWDPDVGSGNIAPPPYGETENGASIYQHDGNGFDARAEAPRRAVRSHRSNAVRENQVVDDNQVVGADPDVNVRSELMRDNEETEF
jgi:hypothetical protein